MEKVDITGLTHEGAGVGRLQDGLAVFVPGALPGERVKIELVARKKNYALARLLEIEKASPDRVLPPCPEAHHCGGCHLQHLDYRAQLLWKRRLVVEALQRLGGLRDIRVLPVVGMANPWGYRNKVRLHVARGRLGFYRPGSHEVVPSSHCPLLPAGLLELAREMARLLPGLAPGLKHVTLRQGRATGELLVALEVEAGWPGGKELAVKLAGRFLELVGVVALPFNNSREAVEETILYGRDYLEERLGELRFHISATTFFQVNTVQAETLYNQAAAFTSLQGGEEVLDAYCGSGAIALWLSRQAGRVTGVEVVAEAIAYARRNAALNNITNTRFRAGAAEVVLPRLAGAGYRPEVVILDPPRAGCDRRVLAAVAVMAPRRVVYVSCNPATLARDLAYLREAGFTPGPVQPVDMFPHTHHVECCALLIRGGK
ncbi:MAG: rRNA (uracil1939-C5)-methyltransferase [Moorella sp. (in: firmicutes)]|jgi:23S rRNA (uracil1939-C5)-methyltransferase|nr:rRNA (uracil1939-C5)-methyltransferase [Moorella sp. (in: firmicutes)]